MRVKPKDGVATTTSAIKREIPVIVIGNRFTKVPRLGERMERVKALYDVLTYETENWFHKKDTFLTRVYDPVRGEFVDSYRWDGRETYVVGDLLPTGLCLAYWEEIMAHFPGYTVRDEREAVEFHPFDAEGLRGQQDRLLHDLMYRISPEGGGLMLSATSTGKTFVAGRYFKLLKGRGIFLVDELALGVQTKLDLEECLGEPVGFVGDTERNYQRITVGSAQTLAKVSLPKLEGADVMIVDEFHTMLNNRTWKVYQKYMPKVVIGMTGTLDVMNETMRYKAYALAGKETTTYTVQQARKDGLVATVHVFYVDIPYFIQDADLCKSPAEIYRLGVVNNEWVNEFIAILLRFAIEDKFGGCAFVRYRDHCDRLADKLAEQGVGCTEYSGRVSKAVRAARRLHRHKNLESDALLSTTGTMTKGASIGTLSFLVDDSQSSKWESTVQRAGRLLRMHSTKEYAVYVDLGFKGIKHRGIFMPNPYEKAARERRAGMRAEGYADHTKLVVDTSQTPWHEASQIYSTIIKVVESR